jgi:hypothetical protein
MKIKSYVVILLLQFLASNCLAAGHEEKSYTEILNWWRSIYQSLEKNTVNLDSHELKDLNKFRTSVKILENKVIELNTSFDRSLSIDHKLIENIEMYCNAVREVTSLADPIDHLLLSMTLGLEHSAAVHYFYKNVKNTNGDYISECNDTKWNL